MTSRLFQRLLCAAPLLAAVVAFPALGLDQATLSSALEEARVEMKMPGLRAAVRTSDGRILHAAVGLGDVEAERPLDNSIGMPGGSTGKTFVAALTMLLVEDGTLSLDDPASRWVGDRPWLKKLPNADQIRVRHLLSHSSGIGDYPGRPGFLFSMIGRVLRHGSAYFEPEELIAFAHSRRAPFRPGEGFRYSDVGYLVLGRVIEAAAGRGYYELVTERILEPLELDEIRVADQTVLERIATGYSGGARSLKKDGRMKLDPRSEWTGGGLVTNPTMLVEFYGALAEGRVVSPESLKLMIESGYRSPSGEDLHYGYGVFVHAPSRSFGHGGLWSGYRTHVAHFLGTGLTIAVQTNRDGRLDLEALVGRIARLAVRGKE